MGTEEWGWTLGSIWIHNHIYIHSHECAYTNAKKMWYIHIRGFYSADKKNEVVRFPGQWVEFENIILEVWGDGKEECACGKDHTQLWLCKKIIWKPVVLYANSKGN